MQLGRHGINSTTRQHHIHTFIVTYSSPTTSLSDLLHAKGWLLSVPHMILLGLT